MLAVYDYSSGKVLILLCSLSNIEFFSILNILYVTGMDIYAPVNTRFSTDQASGILMQPANISEKIVPKVT
jgi:hypothetical protein